jgi:parallel beta-helix repeat protein
MESRRARWGRTAYCTSPSTTNGPQPAAAGAASVVARVGALLALLASVGGQDVFADVLRVPEDHRSIQEAVDVAVAGDVVRVGPGTYQEHVLITNKSSIRLEGDPLHAAVLDGAGLSGSQAAILVQGPADDPVRNVSVVGFTIRNYGGPGISFLSTTSGEIRSNTVDATGGPSIMLARSTFTTIAGNAVSNGSIGIGMSMVSTDNTVKENTISGSFTHGIRVSMVNPLPLRNTIKENVICLASAGSALTGILVAQFAAANAVRDNRIVGNGATTAGIKLEAPTSHNDVRDNILNENAIDVQDQGTENTVKKNVHDPTLACP